MQKGESTSFSYEIVSCTGKKRLKRGETVQLQLKVRNTGSREWYDFGSKELLPPGNSRTGLVFNDPIQINDFKLKKGLLEGKTDLKFAEVITSSTDKDPTAIRVAKPGDLVRLDFELTAKKYATSGKQELSVGVGDIDTNRLFRKTGDKNVYIKVLSQRSIRVRHWLRTLKLALFKPGKVVRQTTNQAYEGNKADTAVVMAVWARVENLQKSIDSLINQKGVKVELSLWLNNKKIAGQVDDIVQRSRLPIKVLHSKYNIGGFGRFFGAAYLDKKFDPYTGD